MNIVGRLINKHNQRYAVAAKDLLKKNPKWDYHIHTTFTDGKATIEELVNRAIKIGLTRIIFTEHTEPWMAKDSDWFGEYVELITYYRDKHKGEIEIFIGIEAPAIDYEKGLQMTEEMERNTEFILGAAHRYPDMGNRKVKDLTTEEAVEFEFNTLMALSNNDRIDSIAHIGATCAKYCASFPMELSRKIIRNATKNGIAVEINHTYHRPLTSFLQVCIEENAYLTLGSNAHRLQDIGKVSKELSEIHPLC
ncbi:MAG: hypothetical protein COA57_01035 [Flavobacteriales bacterium]|nr:MAG: hypothetical protein COA57_01035 [Flavobacteriales bacterium]